jgi:hypothetical protein
LLVGFGDPAHEIVYLQPEEKAFMQTLKHKK